MSKRLSGLSGQDGDGQQRGRFRVSPSSESEADKERDERLPETSALPAQAPGRPPEPARPAEELPAQARPAAAWSESLGGGAAVPAESQAAQAAAPSPAPSPAQQQRGRFLFEVQAEPPDPEGPIPEVATPQAALETPASLSVSGSTDTSGVGGDIALRPESLQQLKDFLDLQQTQFARSWEEMKEQVSRACGASSAGALSQEHTRPSTPASAYSTSSCTSRTPPYTSGSNPHSGRRSVSSTTTGFSTQGAPAVSEDPVGSTLHMWSRLGSTLDTLVERNTSLEQENNRLKAESLELDRRIAEAKAHASAPRGPPGSPCPVALEPADPSAPGRPPLLPHESPGAARSSLRSAPAGSGGIVEAEEPQAFAPASASGGGGPT